jgi:hypothetical protein
VRDSPMEGEKDWERVGDVPCENVYACPLFIPSVIATKIAPDASTSA